MREGLVSKFDDDILMALDSLNLNRAIGTM